MAESSVQVRNGVQGGTPNAEQFSLLFELSRAFNSLINLDSTLR